MAVTRNPFNTRLSWKWLVAIGVLAIVISLVIGIILGVVAVHFSNVTSQSAASTGEEDQRAVNALISANQTTDTPGRIGSTSSEGASLPGEKYNAEYVTPATTEITLESTSMETVPEEVEDSHVTSINSSVSDDRVDESTSVTAETTRPHSSVGDDQVDELTSVTAETTGSASTIETAIQAGTESTSTTFSSEPEESRIRPGNETVPGNPSWNVSVSGDNITTMEQRPPWLNGSANTSLNTPQTTYAATSSSGVVLDPHTIQEHHINTDIQLVSITSTELPSTQQPPTLSGDTAGDSTLSSESNTDSPPGQATNDIHMEELSEDLSAGTTLNPTTVDTAQATNSLETDEAYRNLISFTLEGSPTTTEGNRIDDGASTFTTISSSDTESPVSETAFTTTKNPVTHEVNADDSTSSTATPTVNEENVTDGATEAPLEAVRVKSEEEEESDSVILLEPDFPCPGSPNINIYREQLCDGAVDCPEATDEKDCNCLQRMGRRNRICDGVIDCPSMEDELGCLGCNETQFTCEIRRGRSLCIPLRQRCDGFEHCPNGMDEAGCSQLSPIEDLDKLSQATIPKYGFGYVLRNIQNKWYPLCAPPQETDFSLLAHSICLMTVGESTESPIVSRVAVGDAAYSGKFAVADLTRRRPFKASDTCTTSELLTITCPLPQCGKKAPSIEEAVKKAFRSLKLAKSTDDIFGSASEDPRSSTASLRQSLVKPKRRRRNAFHRIVGGVFSEQGGWPSMVAILKDGNFTCGGTLVMNGSWILSAAHCFESLQRHHYEAQLGMLRTTSFSPFEQARVITDIHIHPGYNRVTLEDDIALLEVDRPFDISQWAAPSCLSSTQFSSANKTKCIVIGWGDVSEGGPESEQLREVTIPLTECTVETTVSRNKVLCAGYPDGQKDACQGDSGGPLMCPDADFPGRWTLAGVVSSGIGCARPGLAGVYTRLSHYLSWIHATTQHPETPTKKPRQECPGMTCRRGAGRCLTSRLRCDFSVDCFGAEDETDCLSPVTTEAPVTITTLTKSTSNVATDSLPLSTSQAPSLFRCADGQFTCFRNFQCVDVSRRCNFVKDCVDGTDELNCTCADYLVGLGKKELICDDHVDCKDSSDELGCRVCPEGEYFSFVSSECIPVRKMCDGTLDASRGDDESACVALSTENRLELDSKARPKYTSNGTVFINVEGDWQPLCASDSLSLKTQSICSSLGFPKVASVKVAPEAETEPFQFRLETPSSGFLWKSPTPSWITARVPTKACQKVNVACENYRCGTRPAFTSSGGTEGNAPWHVTLFANGKYLCGATLVHEKWAVTTATCLGEIDLTRDYVAALMGPQRLIPLESPTEQIRRISGYTALPNSDQLLLLRFEQPATVNQFVNPICLPDSTTKSIRQLLKKDTCLTVGLNGTLLTSIQSVSAKIDGVRSISVLWHNNETFQCTSDKLVGGLACSDGNQWHLVALSEKDCNKQNSFNDSLPGVWRQASAISNIVECDERTKSPTSNRRKRQSSCPVPVSQFAAPSCTTWRCPLGTCLSSEQICDGVPDCRDFSDENHCCSSDQYRCPTGECIARSQLCDGVPDCSDGIDEDEPSANLSCPKNVFRCLLPEEQRSNETVPFEEVCNGRFDCSNEADERTCLALSKELHMKTDNNGNPEEYPNAGYLLVRLGGTWVPYCDNFWNETTTTATCDYFAFNSTGAFKKEVLGTNSDCDFKIHISCF